MQKSCNLYLATKRNDTQGYQTVQISQTMMPLHMEQTISRQIDLKMKNSTTSGKQRQWLDMF